MGEGDERWEGVNEGRGDPKQTNGDCSVKRHEMP